MTTDALLRALREARRSLLKTPAFSLLVIATLGLGIGANVAIFGVVDAVLLRPLELDREERLMRVFNDWGDSISLGNLSVPLYFDVLERTDTFEDFALFWHFRGRNLSAGAGEPEYVDTLQTTASLFDVLSVRPHLGRAFSPEEDHDGGERVALLSHELWMRRFDADPAVLGRELLLEEEEPYTVIGVLPPGLEYPSPEIGLWLPARFDPDERSNRGNHSYHGVGRLPPGVSPAAAEQAIADVGRLVRADHPDSYPESWGMVAVPYRVHQVGSYRGTLIVLLMVVGVVLLVACGNVANLFLARGAGRTRDLAIRRALGAGGTDLVRQLVLESTLLAALGGAIGCGLAWALLQVTKSSLPFDVPGLYRASLDGRVLAFAGLATIATTLLFSLAPALSLLRSDVESALRMRGGRPPSRGLRASLVCLQVALATAVVLVSGLLIRSLLEQQRIDLGFDPEGVVSAGLVPRRDGYGDSPALRSLAERVVESLERRPEIDRAALVNVPPLGGYTDRWIWVEGHPPPAAGERLNAQFRVVTPGYFGTMGIPALAGRLFSPTDDQEVPQVVVISRSMAREFWGELDPIGRRFKLGIDSDSDSPWLTVIGVVGDVRQQLLANERSTFYRPFAQRPFRLLHVVARGSGDPATMAGALERAVLDVDPEQPVFRVRRMTAVVHGAGGRMRFSTGAVGAFSVLALLLAAIGTYGVVSASVAERRRALAIGIALGAKAGDVVRLAFGRELWWVAAGIGGGLLTALAAGRALERSLIGGLLYRVEPSDPAAALAAGAALIAAAAVACWGPARRAQAVEPIEVLRDE